LLSKFTYRYVLLT